LLIKSFHRYQSKDLIKDRRPFTLIAKDKIPKNKLTKKYANLHEKNFKALINNTKANLNKCKDTQCPG